MKIEDKISTDAIKQSKDVCLSAGVKSLSDEKVKAFEASGLDALVSLNFDIFNSIKSLISKYSPQFPISIDIVEDNKEQFFNNIKGFEEGLPEDLK